jgi:hypothetical protein
VGELEQIYWRTCQPAETGGACERGPEKRLGYQSLTPTCNLETVLAEQSVSPKYWYGRAIRNFLRHGDVAEEIKRFESDLLD